LTGRQALKLERSAMAEIRPTNLAERIREGTPAVAPRRCHFQNRIAIPTTMNQASQITHGGEVRNGFPGPPINAEDFIVLTVIFTPTTDPLGVTEAGENAQVAPPGKFVQLNWTSLLNPLEGVRLTV
jgi:hypothetical protein